MESAQRNEKRRVQKRLEEFVDEPAALISENQESDQNHMSCDETSLSSSESFMSSSEVYESDSAVSDSDDEIFNTFSSELAQWVTKFRPSREATNALLQILASHGMEVPKDCRTLVKTPRTVVVENKCGGTYHYLGIANGIMTSTQQDKNVFDKIALSINIDGLPLCNSSSAQLWPILGSINDSWFVFPIAVFHGFKKPDSVSEYLEDFILEAKNLIENGVIINNKCFEFSIKCFICDAPARSFLKCTIGHTGYFSCERCDIKGTRIQNRTTFQQNTVSSKRTGASFESGLYLGSHQHQLSPLLDLGINCVDMFPLDYMHLVLLGVIKRMLKFLTKGPSKCRLSNQLVSQISNKLVSHNGRMPSEFNRQPRGLNDLCYWKSTELRQFLLYHGPVVLKGVLCKNAYEHFLALHVAMTLLLRKGIESEPNLIQYAKRLLIWYVEKCPEIYGETFVVYNIHSLVHLANDVEHFQCCLNEICAFKFENFMQEFKKSVRSSKNPVCQIVKRFQERSNIRKPTNQGTNGVKLNCGKDSCFLDINGNICIVDRIDGDIISCRLINKTKQEPFYTSPLHSTSIYIASVRNYYTTTFREKQMQKKELIRKIVMLPNKNGYVFFPLLHTCEATFY